MPIKFRCQQCRQLLGISRSQAGQQVDCPQCGRSVQVPLPKGQKKPRQRPAPEPASNLVSALQELSALSGDEPSQHASATAGFDEAQRPQATLVVKETQAPPPPELISSNDSDEFQQPVSLQGTLAELAEFEPTTPTNGQLSSELLLDMKSASNQKSAWPIALFCALLAGGLGFFSGWKLMPIQTSSDVVQHKVAKPNADAAAEPAQDVLPAKQYSGNVTYRTESGDTRPDDGSLIIALPAEHSGTWKLNAQAFRQPTDNADRNAAIAALRAFGGDVAEANAAGEFSIDAKPGQLLLAVSKHSSQADNVPNPLQIELLQTWFDAPGRLTGRLAVQVKPVTEETTVNIAFETASP